MIRLSVLAVSLLALPLVTAAQDDPGWAGEVAANGSTTTGNNETTDVGIAFKLQNRGSDWRHNLRGSTDYGRNSGKTSKRRYRLGYKIGRDLAPRVYSFLNADYYSDDFGAYKHGWYTGGGVGYSVLVDEPTRWRLEAGAGYRSQKERLSPGTPGGEASRKEGFFSTRLYSDFEHAFSDQVKITNDTELFYSEVDTYFINEVAVTSRMFYDFALRASFRVETHTEVPVGREKTDTISRIGIVYTLK
jgi:putative salt-induced outer membrane protein